MTQDPEAQIVETGFGEALGERYLSYALSTIMARSLPDVRDGLKPVHRRLLFAMRELGLDSRGSPKKAARVVGDVIGKFHPHGDIAVYDALVRLAQDFSLRYPLIQGQGNFGNIDGDNAAAMRYTEARLTEVAELLLDGLAADAVDLRATYDGEHEEPVVLPAAFPNLLANGANGIAVGMATAIPPHNLPELCDALLHLLQHPDCATADLVAHVRGPDFPTGGVLVEGADAIRLAYESGRGSFRVRARWSVEPLKGGLWQIVIDEIPYQVAKARLIERIAELMGEKKLVLLADIRDESTEDVRIVLEPKSRSVEPAALMESLFRQTDLEARLPLNLNVIDGAGVPRVMSLKQALQAYLDHRHEVLVRRSRHRLGVIDRRLEIIDGLIVAYLNLDEVIRIIREEDEPKPALIARFSLSDVQVEAVLNTRLRALRKLEEMELRAEGEELRAERATLIELLGDESRRKAELRREIKVLRKRFGPQTPLGARRTRIDGPPAVVIVPITQLVEREPITVICSKKGWIRAVRGHDADPTEIRYKDGDAPGFLLPAQSVDRLLFFASDGRVYTLGADKLPRGRGFGEPLRLMIDLANEVDLIAIHPHRPSAKLLLAANDGKGFVAEEDELIGHTKAGKQVLTPADGSRAAFVLPIVTSHLAAIGENRKILIFAVSEVPVMQRGRGVTLQRYKDGAMVDLIGLDPGQGLSFPFGSRVRQITDLSPWIGPRGSAGRLAPPGFPRDNRFAR